MNFPEETFRRKRKKKLEGGEGKGKYPWNVPASTR